MSRMIVFGLNGASMGEIHGNCPRSWFINDGGQTTVSLPSSAAAAKWLDFGRMVLVEHTRLPAWAGMIDTPWTATLPVEMTLYNAAYLLHLRTLETAIELTGSTGAIALQLLARANALEDLRIRPGDIDMNASQKIKFDQRPIWEQLLDLVKNTGMEMRLRPGRDAENKLVIWLDIKKMLGIDTGYLLHDGANHNLEITKATIENEIWNRVIGLASKGSTALIATPQVDEESKRRYRLRNQVVQFQNISDAGQLAKNALVSLQDSAYPELKLTVNILDVGTTFSKLDLGNQYMVHAAKLWLPAGIQGWRGLARLTAMAYDEANNKIAATLIGAL